MPLPLFFLAGGAAAAAAAWLFSGTEAPEDVSTSVEALEAELDGFDSASPAWRGARLRKVLPHRAALGDAVERWWDEDPDGARTWIAEDGETLVARAREVTAHVASTNGGIVGEVLVIGATGVGKSTLVNAVLGRDAAETGAGAPVTKGVERHAAPDGRIVLVDTEGIELGDASGRLNHLVSLARLADVTWYCINDQRGRVQPTDVRFVRALATAAPVIVVLTRVVEEPELESAVREELHGVPVVPLLAKERRIGTTTFPATGLDALATAHVAAVAGS